MDDVERVTPQGPAERRNHNVSPRTDNRARNTRGVFRNARESAKKRWFHFDGIYLSGYRSGKVAFISHEFRQLMLEIWRVKFLEVKRFREVIRSTTGSRLLHFLNDGDSPDIPIRIYVAMLEEIRELALQ